MRVYLHKLHKKGQQRRGDTLTHEPQRLSVLYICIYTHTVYGSFGSPERAPPETGTKYRRMNQQRFGILRGEVAYLRK